MKIAIVQYKPTYSVRTGYENTSINIAKILKRIKNTDVRVFSLGKKNFSDLIDNEIPQEVVKSTKYPENGFGIRRMADFVSIYLFEKRLSQEIINKNKAIQRKLTEFNPDIIVIGSIQPYGIIKRYKNTNKNVKIISYTDSPKILEDAFNSIDYLHIPNKFKTFIKKNLKKKYTNYVLNVYNKMLELSDAIVVPSKYDKERIVNETKVKKDKIFIIPPIMVDNVPKQKFRGIKTIKTALFIGTCTLYANAEAIKIIAEEIAPKLPQIKFLIFGKGCNEKREGNFIILNDKVSLKAALDKADICLAPLLQEGGMKTKMATYFSAGKPTIGTSIAFEGYNAKNGFNAIIEDDIGNYYKRIMELDKNIKKLNVIKKNIPLILKDFTLPKLKIRWVVVIKFILKDV
jgi:glycosyltransferase involved in cell wall biosynthesis